jgi:glycosyltransferase 2 family protein
MSAGTIASPISPRMRRSIIVGGVLAVTALAGYSVLVGGAQAQHQFSKLTLPVIAGCLGLALVNYCLRAMRWSLFCRHLGLSSGLPRDALNYVAGFPMGMTPGKVGEVVRLWLMQRSSGHHYVDSGPLLIVDRAYDLLALAAIATIGVGAFAGPIWVALTASALVGLGGVVMLAYPQLLRHSVDVLFRFVSRAPRVFVKLRQFCRSFERLSSWRLGALAFALSFLGWGAEVLLVHQIAVAVGVDISLSEAGFVFSAAMVLGAFALIPGGLGVTDVSMIGLLTALGVDLADASVITVAARACTLWFSVAIGGIALPAALWVSGRDERNRAG